MLMIKEHDKLEQQRVQLGETVKTPHGVGEVVGYSGGLWEVKMTDGNVIKVAESQMQVRQILLG